MYKAERTFHSLCAMLATECRRQMHVVLQMDRHVPVPEVRAQWSVLVLKYRQKGKLDVVWCGPYKVREVLNKSKNVEPDIPAPFDGLGVSNRDSIKPYIRRGDSQCGILGCHLSRLELLLDLLRFWLDVE